MSVQTLAERGITAAYLTAEAADWGRRTALLMILGGAEHDVVYFARRAAREGLLALAQAEYEKDVCRCQHCGVPIPDGWRRAEDGEWCKVFCSDECGQAAAGRL